MERSLSRVYRDNIRHLYLSLCAVACFYLFLGSPGAEAAAAAAGAAAAGAGAAARGPQFSAFALRAN